MLVLLFKIPTRNASQSAERSLTEEEDDVDDDDGGVEE